MAKPHLYDGEIFEHEGLRFRVRFEFDDMADKPWENDYGRGPVRESRERHAEGYGRKRPGERPLNQAGRNELQFYYDWQEAMKIAKRDGWNAEPYDAPGQAARAVAADFEYLRAWLNDEWHYCIVIIERLGADDKVLNTDNLGMVETYKNYHVEQAYEMAEGMASEARETWRKALSDARAQREADQREAQEALYWQSRDVMTGARA